MERRIVCQEIFEKLMSELPTYWDGKETISYMKENGCNQWRQMEWPRWYFQFMCEQILEKEGFFEIPGPTYGNVEFDGKRIIPWDFKAHTENGSSKDKVPTNGYCEVKDAIGEYGCVGFIIASGTAVFDDNNQSFKRWHDELKGGKSKYELERISRGASSRRRKAAFELDSIRFVFLDENTLGYCGKFQSGMRNSNGTLRNPKVMLKLSDSRLEQYTFEI